MPDSSKPRPPSITSVVQLGPEVARMLVDRMRVEIDRAYDNPASREGAWSSFLAMAGEWATDEGLERPGAFQAIKTITEKLRGMLPKRNATQAGIPPVRR